jgi:uncharacterized protein with HEPN domain
VRSDRLRLQDILDAMAVIEQYLPKDRQVFDRDPPLQSHIYRHVIVGEAVWSLSDGLKKQHPEIPWKKIEGMRHIMVHDYFRVDWNVVFETATTHVPALKPTINSLLTSLASE